ncbi:MAG: flagellar assembly peptidoglycan hydrolase FlgJ, partial [Alteromonadales bacterium]|nr:flagellar assembly peptidoglycan hydrolase FlgJ [Alteromonadales bacterium]
GSLGLTDLIVRQLGGDSGGFKPSSVLRNDGNLTKSNNITVVDDNAKKDAQHNSLIEKMLSDKGHITPDIDVPFAGNYQANASMQNQMGTLSSQLSTREVDKRLFKDVSKPQSVNNSAPLSNQSFNEPQDFVTALIEPAQKVQQTLGVPFEVVIAQAALETGWGQKMIKAQDGGSSNNLFNIKADSRWAGDKITKETLEFEQGAMVKKSEPFRTYQSLTDSVDDYINFLSTSERYQDALQQSGNVEHFLQGLQKAGYATDPQYADKILGTLKTVTNLLAK